METVRLILSSYHSQRYNDYPSNALYTLVVVGIISLMTVVSLLPTIVYFMVKVEIDDQGLESLIQLIALGLSILTAGYAIIYGNVKYMMTAAMSPCSNRMLKYYVHRMKRTPFNQMVIAGCFIPLFYPDLIDREMFETLTWMVSCIVIVFTTYTFYQIINKFQTKKL
jgi:hypothetical protein